MIKSSKISIKFANKIKREIYLKIVSEYRKSVRNCVAELWKMEQLPKSPDSSVYKLCGNFGNTAFRQACARQALQIVKGTRKKLDAKKFVVEKLLSERKFDQARKLQKKIDETTISMPNLTEFGCQLNHRFVNVELENANSFDGWLKIKTIGNGLSVLIPFKRHKQFNKLMSCGKLLNGARLHNKTVEFTFEIPDVKNNGRLSIGIDIGQKSILSTSDGQQVIEDKDGYTYRKICEKLARKQKGSKSFQRTTRHRTNFIRWSLNQLNLDDIKEIKIEKLKNIYKGKRISRTMSHWNYRELRSLMISYFKEKDVLVSEVSPSYTSQCCSICGRVRKSNRKGSTFKCDYCGNTMDADLNASKNIALNRRPLNVVEVRLKKLNVKGFFWNSDGSISLSKKPIVSCT